MKEDVKKKIFSLPSKKTRVVSCIQPCLLVRGVLGYALWVAAHCRGDASASLSQLNGFMSP